MKTLLTFLLVLSGSALAVETSPADWVRRLGSDEPQQREAASDALRDAFEAAEKAGKQDEMKGLMVLLKEALNASDPEVRFRAEAILRDFREGGCLWLKQKADLPGPVLHLAPSTEGILAAGESSGGKAGWAGCFALCTGKVVWEARFPSPVEDLIQDGERVFLRGTSWIEVRNGRNGEVLWSGKAFSGPVLGWTLAPEGLLAWGRPPDREVLDPVTGSKMIHVPEGQWALLYDPLSGKPLWEKQGKLIEGELYGIFLFERKPWALGTCNGGKILLLQPLEDGNPGLSVPFPEGVLPMGVFGSDVFLSVARGQVSCVRIPSGEIAWQTAFPKENRRDWPYRALAVQGKVLAWGDGKVAAFAREDGKLLWQESGEILRISGEEVLLLRDDRIRRLEAASGRPLQTAGLPKDLGYNRSKRRREFLLLPECLMVGGRPEHASALKREGMVALSDEFDMGWLGAVRLKDAGE